MATAPTVPRILSPIDRPEEVVALAAAGAGELYGGVQPDTAPGRFLSANQRTFAAAQFPNEGAFREAVAEARRHGIPLQLVLNAPLFSPDSQPHLLGLLERAVSWGISGAIIGDPGLLARVSARQLGVKLTLSTMAGLLNRHAVTLFRRWGITRVVLPRHLRLQEMGEIVAAHPDLGFEAFVLIGRCPNEEAFCTFQHVAKAQRWPCEIPYELAGESDCALPDDHPLVRWHLEWRGVDRRLGCGLCAVRQLARIGVEGLKVVGRGGPTRAKVENVSMVARALADGGHSSVVTRKAYAARFGRQCSRLNCYYPELRGDVLRGTEN